jgi:hypothetical protein
VDNTTDPSVTLNWKHTGQTFVSTLMANYLKQSVVDQEETTPATIGNQLGNPIPGDTGYLTFRDRRQLAEITPDITFDLTQRRHLELSADYTRVDYDPVLPGFYVGYGAASAAAAFIQDLTQRETLTFRGRASTYDPQGDFGTTRSYGLEGEWGYHVSQVSAAYVRVGGVRSTFEQVAGAAPAPATTGVVAGAGMNWTYQLTQLFLDATRSVQPNGTGYTVDRDQLRLTLTRLFSATLTGQIAGTALRDAPTQSTILFADRTYATALLGLKWRFRRAWTLNGQYTFASQHFASVPPTTGTSNAIVLSIIYEPNRDRVN